MKTSDAIASLSSANRFRNSWPGRPGKGPPSIDFSEFRTGPDGLRVVFAEFAGLQSAPPAQSACLSSARESRPARVARANPFTTSYPRLTFAVIGGAALSRPVSTASSSSRCGKAGGRSRSRGPCARRGMSPPARARTRQVALRRRDHVLVQAPPVLGDRDRGRRCRAAGRSRSRRTGRRRCRDWGCGWLDRVAVDDEEEVEGVQEVREPGIEPGLRRGAAIADRRVVAARVDQPDAARPARSCPGRACRRASPSASPVTGYPRPSRARPSRPPDGSAPWRGAGRGCRPGAAYGQSLGVEVRRRIPGPRGRAACSRAARTPA